MSGPRRDHYLGPTTGHDTESVLEAAIDSLGALRDLAWLGDAPARLPEPSPTPGTKTAPGRKSPKSLESPGPAPTSVTAAAPRRTARPSTQTDPFREVDL